MSFNFDNPSDDDIDLDAFDDTGLLALSSRQSNEAQPAAAASLPTASDVESDIDWEDADDHFSEEEEEYDSDRKLPALPSRGVTVTFSSASNTPAEEKDEVDATPKDEDTSKKRRRAVRVLKDVPVRFRRLILDVRRSHLLCCIAHSVRCSSICSDVVMTQSDGTTIHGDEDSSLLLNIAHSLVPLQFHSGEVGGSTQNNMPTDKELRDFSLWFFQFVNAGDRRRDTIRQNAAQGAGAAGQSPLTRKRARKSTAIDSRQSKKKTRHGSSNVSGDNKLNFDASCSFEAVSSNSTTSANSLITKLSYLSPYYDDDPQLFINDGMDVIGLVDSITSLEKVLLFLAMTRYVLTLFTTLVICRCCLIKFMIAI
jgi:hypothetical protein